MARPKIKIDAEQVFRLAERFNTAEDIGYILGCSTDTIKRRFADEIEKGKASGKAKLRNLQWEIAATKKDARMAQWLGIQMLGQSNKTQVEVSMLSDETLASEVSRRLSISAIKPSEDL